MTKQYNVDYFKDRKLKYEKNHGVFIHEFMFTEFTNRILGQSNVALNDLQRQLDLEIGRAKAEEARLDKKIDAETARATGEETTLDGKINDINNLYMLDNTDSYILSEQGRLFKNDQQTKLISNYNYSLRHIAQAINRLADKVECLEQPDA